MKGVGAWFNMLLTYWERLANAAAALSSLAFLFLSACAAPFAATACWRACCFARRVANAVSSSFSSYSVLRILISSRSTAILGLSAL